MKRYILLILIFCLLLSACSATVDLTENDSGQKILEISKDPTDYLGKTIRISGIYSYEEFGGTTYHYVLKATESEENLGFEFRWKGEYPEAGTPILVIGKLVSETVDGYNFIYIRATELHVLTEIR